MRYMDEASKRAYRSVPCSMHSHRFYDELPKEMLMIVVDDEVEEKVCSLIIGTARTGEGNFGDGRIFVTPIKKAYTISSKTEGL